MADEPNSKRQRVNALDALKAMTVVVADTGEVNAIDKYCPEGKPVERCIHLVHLISP